MRRAYPPWRPLAMLGAGLMLACTQQPPPQWPPEPPYEDVLEALARRRCDAEVACGLVHPVVCDPRVLAQRRLGESYAPFIDAGRVRYDVDGGRACLDALRGLAPATCNPRWAYFHVEPEPGPPSVCTGLVSGTMLPGDLCASGFDCLRGYCQRAPYEDGGSCWSTCVVPPPEPACPPSTRAVSRSDGGVVCAPVASLGEPCPALEPGLGYARCSDGFCDPGTGLCSRSRILGEPCSLDAGYSSFCLDPLRCIDGVCSGPAGVGEPCLGMSRCMEGLSCEPAAPGGNTGTCVIPHLVEGDVCTSFMDLCADGSFCCCTDVAGEVLRCKRPARAGEPCVYFAPFCEAGLNCQSDGRCGKPLPPGSSCRSRDLCTLGSCMDGWCVQELCGTP